MKKLALAAAGLLACICVCRAEVAQDVALASESPELIPGLVKTISRNDVPGFVAKLVKVLAAKPASPVARVKGLAGASRLVFSNVPQDSFADAIVASAANVPFNALPEWTRLCKTTTKAISVNMSDPQYDSIVSKVVKGIASLDGVPDENKAVVTICALELLARAESVSDKFAWLRRIEDIPREYRQDVLDGYAAMAKGEYAALLGNTKIIRVADEGEPAAKAEKPAEGPAAAKDEGKPAAGGPAVAEEEEPAVPAAKEHASGRRPVRLVDPAEGRSPQDVLVPGARNLHDTLIDEGGGEGADRIDPRGVDRPKRSPAVKPPSRPPVPPKPVVPEPYRGQF